MTKLPAHSAPRPEVAKGADLDKMRDQAFINIIIGQQPVSDFDKFVDQWKKGGGGDWTNEVNEWWATQPKSVMLADQAAPVLGPLEPARCSQAAPEIDRGIRLGPNGKGHG